MFDPDCNRWDLNGDGVAGSGTERFDLDREDSVQYGRTTYRPDVKQTIEGNSVEFDENSVDDEQILCYYAYSGLYAGTDLADRRRLLGSRCAPLAVDIDPVTVTLPPGGTRQFAAHVRLLVPGSADPLVNWFASDGTITSTGLFTAPATAGTVTVRAISVSDPGAFAEATVTVAGTAGSARLLVGQVTGDVQRSDPDGTGGVGSISAFLKVEVTGEKNFETFTLREASGTAGAVRTNFNAPCVQTTVAAYNFFGGEVDQRFPNAPFLVLFYSGTWTQSGIPDNDGGCSGSFSGGGFTNSTVLVFKVIRSPDGNIVALDFTSSNPFFLDPVGVTDETTGSVTGRLQLVP